ncbi:MAG: hypothetical protein K2Y37_18520 [Pirellulales bacterium]|nr:hypothetical protein [Pirellulales bacterium]
MENTNTPVISSDTLRDDWLKRLSGLIEQIKDWAVHLGWSTRTIEKGMHDLEIGAYTAPALLMQQDTYRVLLEPIARAAPGADGVVDLYLLPAYDDIASLYHYDGEWKLHYMFPGSPTVATTREAAAVSLSEEALRAVLDEMKKHAS